MQNLLRIIVVAVIVLGILSFMTTYTVRFTEKAVVTTFGRADETSVRSEPGLGFRLPYPIQSVTKYDTRARYIEARAETIATADNSQLIITAFATWQVDSPLRFFELYGSAGSRAIDHFRAAEEFLRQQLRSSLSEISAYRVRDILAAEQSASKIAEIEQRMLAHMQNKIGSGDAKAAAIKPLTVGIAAVRLPANVTKNVMDAMQATRNTLSAVAITQGTAEAAAIRSRAENDAKIITQFAARRADAIRAQGDKEAAEFLKAQSENPELAVFLRNLQFMRDAFSSKTTLILSTDEPGLGFLRPDALTRAAAEKLTPPAPAGGKTSTGGAK